MKAISILCYIALIINVQYAQAQFQFISPKASSSLVNVEHNIIIRQGSLLNPSSLKESLFSISGSKSGLHAFRMVLCLDGKTINLNPLVPFAYDETVSVSINKGLETMEGGVVEGYSFNFSTHREWTASEKQRMKNMKKNEMAREFAEDGAISDPEPADTRTITGLFTITTNIAPTPSEIFFNSFCGQGLPSPYYGWHMINTNGDSIYSTNFQPAGDFEMTERGYFAGFRSDTPQYEILDSTFTVIDHYYCVNGYEMDDHDFLMLKDGTVFIMGNDYFIYDMTIFDASYCDTATMRGCVYQEFDANKNLLFEWRGFDYIGIMEALHEKMWLCDIDFIHPNSLYLDNDSSLVSSLRHLDQIIKLNINTGEFIWRIGGINNEFVFINEPQPFTYQHDCRRIANGNFTLFDNGNYHPVKYSEPKEYTIDEVNKTITKVWGYKHPNDAGNGYNYYHAQGAVQRLPNGNTFINWGWRLPNDKTPDMTELTPDDSIVWELELKLCLCVLNIDNQGDIAKYRNSFHR